MSAFSRVTTQAMVLAVCLFGSAPAWAESTILSGMFDGAEPAIDALHSYGCAREKLGYVQTTFRVSIDGLYRSYNAFDQLDRHGAVAVYHRVYEGSFNPTAPGQNVKNIPGSDSHKLSRGVTYVLVVQQLCENVEGTWAMAFIGPGSISSDNVVALPTFTKGKFTANDPTMTSDIWGDRNAPYKQSGPVRVSRDGTYYFADMLIGAQVSLQVYTAPVNPANPAVSRVAFAAYGEPLIELQAGQDYYFVTQWISGDKAGEFLYVLAPPSPFRINPGLAGSWHNPDTPGQGFFLTAYEKINQVFLAWFTYAIEPQAGDEFGHRWLTAFGKFAGSSAELAIVWTTGGGFDTATPAPEQYLDGTIELKFTDCSSGQITYGWGFDETDSPVVSGAIPIQRIVNDSVALCESLYAGPGMPGPL